MTLFYGFSGPVRAWAIFWWSPTPAFFVLFLMYWLSTLIGSTWCVAKPASGLGIAVRVITLPEIAFATSFLLFPHAASIRLYLGGRLLIEISAWLAPLRSGRADGGPWPANDGRIIGEPPLKRGRSAGQGVAFFGWSLWTIALFVPKYRLKNAGASPGAQAAGRALNPTFQAMAGLGAMLGNLGLLWYLSALAAALALTCRLDLRSNTRVGMALRVISLGLLLPLARCVLNLVSKNPTVY